ncbi:nuclear transport factor 2 family protein [Haliea sp. E17]|uniref:nuclear transport factor 2 family protein n=1 Tax=Haliea sp. E17 TaxID=3401576 RepID=UPI003AAE4BDD
MDPRLQEMLDHHEITRTVKEYCHGCDRCDEALMGSVYTRDSWDDHGAVSLPGGEFAHVMTGMILDTTESLSHLLGQSLIDVRGDEAGAETYFLAVSHSPREDGVRMCNQLGGRFVDTLVREDDGRWRIRHRVVLRDWSVSLPVEADWTDDAGLRDGARSGEDPACAVLGRVHGGNSYGAAP